MCFNVQWDGCSSSVSGPIVPHCWSVLKVPEDSTFSVNDNCGLELFTVTVLYGDGSWKKILEKTLSHSVSLCLDMSVAPPRQTSASSTAETQNVNCPRGCSELC